MTNPTKLTPSDLAALMCARICHDMVSPIGALGAAIEVLDDENNADMHEDAMDLVRTSAKQATHKLKFLRLAFGAGTSAPGMLGIDLVKSLVDDMYGEGKASISWKTELVELEKNHVRLLLNLIMIGLQCIPRGGELSIDITDSPNAYIISLLADGPKARIYAEYERTLSGKAPDDGFDGRTIQPFYAGMMVRDMKGRIDTSIEGEKVSITAFLPAEKAQSAA